MKTEGVQTMKVGSLSAANECEPSGHLERAADAVNCNMGKPDQSTFSVVKNPLTMLFSTSVVVKTLM